MYDLHNKAYNMLW